MGRKSGGRVVWLVLAALIIGGAGLAAGPITDCWPDTPPPPSAPPPTPVNPPLGLISR